MRGAGRGWGRGPAQRAARPWRSAARECVNTELLVVVVRVYRALLFPSPFHIPPGRTQPSQICAVAPQSSDVTTK